MNQGIISRMAARIEELERENRKLKHEQTAGDFEHERMLLEMKKALEKVMNPEARY
ncbi:hypothetical protein [Planomicrobium sp. YIM 101495]|uniref:hypothetical protein n=1 Tax=Planomicrobium sp. YIM 101495 TaxID=2665160 RepID=UPI0012BA20A4|nr:hypothetical protein [Planomicrobium sp. YIM 101495]MTD30192.1 hypothetical protein [Planomicrobium sp. YIM 101495]